MTAPKRDYAIGDSCWIGLHGSKHLAPGKVCGSFQLPTHPQKYFIIELEDTDWPHLEIRDALLMAPEKGVPLPCWTDSLYDPRG